MLHAVIVGIDIYQDETIPRLEYACADARAISALLQNRLKNDCNVTLLDAAQATRAQILWAIGEKLPAEIEDGDTVILYFATHGSPERRAIRDKRSRFLIPYDASYERLYSTAIDMDRDIPSWMERLKEAGAKLVVLFLDTCFSGAAAPGGRTFMGPTLQKVPRLDGNLEFDAPASLGKLDLGRGLVIFSAADDEQVAVEDSSTKHGVFTNELLKAWTKPRDGQKTIHLGVLYAEVSDGVRNATAGRQEPVLNSRMIGAALPSLAAR